jgi:hypothetical protein
MTRKAHRGAGLRAREQRRRDLFLEALATGASITAAARAAGVDRRTPYKWREGNAAFDEEWVSHMESGTDALEDEARRRAHDGVKRPIYHAGKRVGFVTEHSDQLMMFILRARRPEKYRERQAIEHSGPDGGPIRFMPALTITVRKE